ncbi:MAG TPA: AAA family ATPase [Candidatus Paenibacillus intestinavium]|nr:AAA family ATPase [Candidatus Paenibacillus intestinavium]
MHIKSLSIKNWLGITELVKDLHKVNHISGDSGAGKTSIIEALEKAFTNRDRRTEVISHGASEAEILVQMDDGLQIERRIRTEKSPYLKVKHDSKGVASTEGFLKSLINGDIFRPIEFVGKTAKEQTEIILNMLPIGWAVDDIKSWFGEVPEANYQLHILQILKQIEDAYYSERTTVNTAINLINSNIEGIKRELPPNYDGNEWRAVNLQEQYNKLSEAESANKRLIEAQSLIDGLALRFEDIKQRSANAKEEKRLSFNRQRDSYSESIKRLENKVEQEQVSVTDADQRILDSSIRLDNELEQAIERMKLQYQMKKQSIREDIQIEVEQSRVFIAEYKEQIVEKRSSLSSIDALEKSELERIKEHEDSLIAAEQAKSGDAHHIVDTNELIDVAPLKIVADRAASMKEYLHEWERMNRMIRDDLAPKEERSSALTEKIQKARDLPKQLLMTAALPVEDLSVDSQGRIRINGTLIDGLSEGEAWEFAFKLAKAQSGELKVICLDGWQNLGSRQREIIEAAKYDDYQYFLLETVEGQALKIESMEG